MATVNTFEELMSWQKARTLSDRIHKLTVDGAFARDFGLRDQINRASGSVMDNIAEGFGRGGRKEFMQFLIVAKGSGNEVKSQLYRALDRCYISKEMFEQLYDSIDYIIRMIAKHIEYLKTTEYEGLRYKNTKR